MSLPGVFVGNPSVGNWTMAYQKSQVHIFLYFTNHYKYINNQRYGPDKSGGKKRKKKDQGQNYIASPTGIAKYPVCVEWHGRDPEN